jgi:uncharacterized protein YyaL (SSP411 family)
MAEHTNRLIHESSPYLLQHAHNPVDWYPWGDEALQKAVAEDKPILVSIGYAACHWCHVMERESFEDAETARLMNEHFINIKIDREERPDLDHIYMDAVQAIAGNGGWPLNVFLMPDGKPFYGGTYFPPRAAFNRPSWKDVLQGVKQAYSERKHELASQAENLTAHLSSSNAFGTAGPQDQFTPADLETMAANMMKQADRIHGGFGAAPKFPQTFTIQYLLRHHYFTDDAETLDQALLSLDKMCQGGIYDHLGGGFARYSTDAEWLAPHFEKMLYDNALLVSALAEALQLTGRGLYAEVIRGTVDFVRRELQEADGGFFSALDADSEGVEGKFYTWSRDEVMEILGKEGTLFCSFYDITTRGNWEHTNILRVQTPAHEFAATSGIGLAEFQQFMEAGRQELMAARDKRIRPLLDDKVLLGWNALMNTALSKAFAATLNEEYKVAAVRNMAFLEEKLYVDGRWHHTYKTGRARIPAFLDDLAYLAQACIHLQEITADAAYLLKAKEIAEIILLDYSDEAGIMFYYTPQGQQDVIIRKKEVYDGATPSGNAVMAGVLRYLAKAFDLPEWEERANAMTLSLRSAITRYPTSFGCWAQQVQLMVHGVRELAVTGDETMRILAELLPVFVPDKVLQSAEKGDENFPLLRNRYIGKTLIYHCKNYVCTRPHDSVEALLGEMKK